jgi:hypothetical protein
MNYTIKNLDETKDSVVEFSLAELGEAHFPRDDQAARSCS